MSPPNTGNVHLFLQPFDLRLLSTSWRNINYPINLQDMATWSICEAMKRLITIASIDGISLVHNNHIRLCVLAKNSSEAFKRIFSKDSNLARSPEVIVGEWSKYHFFSFPLSDQQRMSARKTYNSLCSFPLLGYTSILIFMWWRSSGRRCAEIKSI